MEKKKKRKGLVFESDYEATATLDRGGSFLCRQRENNIQSVSETQQATKLYFCFFISPPGGTGWYTVIFTKEFQSEGKEREEKKQNCHRVRDSASKRRTPPSLMVMSSIPPLLFQLLISSVQRLTGFWTAITCHSFQSVMNGGSACGCTLRNSKEKTSRRKKHSGFLFIYAIKDVCPT